MAHKKNGQDAHDMTKGPILRQLIVFALPLLGSSLVQQLYNTADVFFVGNYAGKNAAAAVGASSLIFTCLIGLFTGLSVGAGIIVAHAWGRGDVAEARNQPERPLPPASSGVPSLWCWDSSLRGRSFS